MPKRVSYAGSFEDMPLSVQRAARVPRDYVEKALCRPDAHPEYPSSYFTAEPTVTYLHGKQKVKGSVLLEWALTICHICPVQWECALVALEADERAGVWGDTLENLRSVTPAFIQTAKVQGVPVQVAIRSRSMA
jgi:hypothetical protein